MLRFMLNVLGCMGMCLFFVVWLFNVCFCVYVFVFSMSMETYMLKF